MSLFAQTVHYWTGEQNSFRVGDLALSYESRATLRASVRRHRRAQGGSPMLRSITPKRASYRDVPPESGSSGRG